MSSVYSTRFLLGTGPSSGTISYTVPAGRVAVVKNLDSADGTSGDAVVLRVNGLPILQHEFPALGPGAGGSWSVATRIVLNAGDVLTLAFVGTPSAQVSGYLFNLSV